MTADLSATIARLRVIVRGALISRASSLHVVDVDALSVQIIRYIETSGVLRTLDEEAEQSCLP